MTGEALLPPSASGNTADTLLNPVCNDKTAVRLRRVDADAELGSVQELNPAPLTFGHVDLPTGKRIYVPLEPGQDARREHVI